MGLDILTQYVWEHELRRPLEPALSLPKGRHMLS
jgi:hypothetical protein